MKAVSLTINGTPTEALVEPRTHLADFIRDSQNLTGTHIGCEHGVCGACTVLIDGAPARSCITYAIACEGASITTVEGLEDEISAELREAFSREHGLQCGYCTPGMLISAHDAVSRLPDADEREVRILMSGNLCRCTGYVGIVRAVRSVIADRRARGIPPRVGGGIMARGPVGSDHAPSPLRGSVSRTGPSAVPPQADAPGGARVEGMQTPHRREDWRPQVTFEQHFTVAHPPEKVWQYFGRPAEVAACLPGAVLVGEPTETHVEGKLRVKAGPIVAEFRGAADIGRDVAHYSGMIRGRGQDSRSGSVTRGEIAYKLSPEDGGNATRVDVTVGYTLTGMLAQFSRSGLIHDVANRMTEAFAKNLEARLGGGEGQAPEPAPAAELNAGSLILSIFRGRLRLLIRRLFGR